MRRQTAMVVVLALSFAAGAVAADLELQPHGAPKPVPQRLQSAEPPPATEGATGSGQAGEKESADDKKMDGLHVPSPDATPQERESWWRDVVRRAPPGCRTFSDGCRRCDPDFKCSSLPIACQPREFSCIDPKP